MSFNKVKSIKRISREDFKDFTKHGGPHQSKERRKPHMRDWLREYEEDLKDKDDNDEHYQVMERDFVDSDDDSDTPYGER